MPVLTVIAGPNGSGKSTITRALDFAGCEKLLDPDVIARSLSPSAAHRDRQLASRRTLETMRNAKTNGFRIVFVYICLDTPERSVLRVNERVIPAMNIAGCWRFAGALWSGSQQNL